LPIKLLFILGTRPEAIKLAPLIKECKKRSGKFAVSVCSTAQHKEMLDQVLRFFEIVPDYNLGIMQNNQTLFGLTARCLAALEKVVAESRPDTIIVQGDTTTAFVGALAGFYGKTKVAHVEAGLRSNNKCSPFPEEINRRLVSVVADYHFAPTSRAAENLKNEGISSNVWVTGNTGIDALFLGLSLLKKNGDAAYSSMFAGVNFARRVMLVTLHRRESFGVPLENICEAFKQIIQNNPDVELVYPVHLNPNVLEPVKRILGSHPRVHLMEPLDYPGLLWIMNKCFCVLTDSGGIQEEAPSLGKPVLVLRDVTERQEGIDAGTAKLLGTDRHAIVEQTEHLLTNKKEYAVMAHAVNPYGEGAASEKIADALKGVK